MKIPSRDWVHGEVKSPGRILDLSMSLYEFLAVAMRLNPGAEAVSFTQNIPQNGHEEVIGPVKLKHRDIRMLIADIWGVPRLSAATKVLASRPDQKDFVTEQ